VSYAISPIFDRLAAFRVRGRVPQYHGTGSLGQESSLTAMSIGMPSSTTGASTSTTTPAPSGGTKPSGYRPEPAKTDLSHFVSASPSTSWAPVMPMVPAPDNTLTYIGIGGAAVAVALITVAMRPAPARAAAPASVSPNVRRRRRRK